MSPNPWLPEFTRIDNDRASGLTYEPGYPATIVSHSTEGTISEGGMRVHESPPHFWTSWRRKLQFQTVMLGRGSYAMGGDFFPTNRKMNCVQIEIEGFAVTMATDLTEADYKWLGEAVYAPIIKWFLDSGVAFDFDGAPDPSTEQIGGSAAGDAPQRFSQAKWLSFNSNCGHRHVPGQDQRYDPGLMDLRKPLFYAKQLLQGVTPAPTTAEEEDMLTQFWNDKSGLVFTDGVHTWPVERDETRIMYENFGILRPVVYPKPGDKTTAYTQVGDKKVPFRLDDWNFQNLKASTVSFENREVAK